MEENTNKHSHKPRWQTAQKEFYRTFKDERDRLKRNMTPAEKKLWEFLRNKNFGVKFRRQHIIDFYIPDFVALSIRLIIEIDGKIHLKQKQQDEERTRRLELLGFKVIRFTNEEVENEMDKVLESIKNSVHKLKNRSLF